MATTLQRRSIGRTVLVGLVVLGVVTWLPGTGSASATTTQAAAEESLAGELNRARTEAGLAPLGVAVQLTGVARRWSAQMAADDRLAHNPGYAAQITGGWQRVAENVGFAQDASAQVSGLVASLHSSFMNSQGHRDNVLGDYDQVGVGAVLDSAGKLWVTVNFAKLAASVPLGALDEAAEVSRREFAPDSVPWVVLARSEVFADALSGSALAGSVAPILYTPGPAPGDPDPVLHPRTRVEIDRVLPAGGIVYLLGGTGAISDTTSAELGRDGYQVRRLAGGTRVQTSLRVAEEVVARHGAPAEVLLARSDDWADAISGGAYAAHAGIPVLLTGRESLDPEVAAFLAGVAPGRRIALGGPGALSDAVVAAAGAQRVHGPERTATAVAVARELWGRRSGSPGDAFVVAPGFAEDGWAAALARVPESARRQAPELLVGDTGSQAVDAYLTSLSYSSAVSGELRSAWDVPAPVTEHLRRLLGG